AAAFAVLVLILAAMVSSLQAIRASRAEKSAKAEVLKAAQAKKNASEQAEIARAIKDFLTEQLLSANPYVAPEPNAGKRALLEQVARAVEGKFTNQPLVEAEIRFALETGFAGLSDVTNAVIEAQRVLEIRRRMLGPRNSD